MVVMHTPRREGDFLLGPLHRRVYASFAPKRHAFEIARREADKRGFGLGSGKLIQIVTDGDNVQLRCIEINGDWERFIDWVHDDMRVRASRRGQRLRLQQTAPAPLPVLATAA